MIRLRYPSNRETGCILNDIQTHRVTYNKLRCIQNILLLCALQTHTHTHRPDDIILLLWLFNRYLWNGFRICMDSCVYTFMHYRQKRVLFDVIQMLDLIWIGSDHFQKQFNRLTSILSRLLKIYLCISLNIYLFIFIFDGYIFVLSKMGNVENIFQLIYNRSQCSHLTHLQKFILLLRTVSGNIINEKQFSCLGIICMNSHGLHGLVTSAAAYA